MTSSRCGRGVQLIAEVDDLLEMSGARDRLVTASLPRSMRCAMTCLRASAAARCPPAQIHATGSLVLSRRRASGRARAPRRLPTSVDRRRRRAGISDRVDDFDAGAAEDAEQLVEPVGRGDKWPGALVDFVREGSPSPAVPRAAGLVGFSSIERLVGDVGSLPGWWAFSAAIVISLFYLSCPGRVARLSP